MSLFRSCWKPSAAEYLEKAAAFTCSRDSSLNVTDAVQTPCNRFSQHGVSNELSNNLNVLFTDGAKPEEKNSKPVEELFLAGYHTKARPAEGVCW